MDDSPASSHLFLSSSPTHCFSDPAEEVEILLAHARKVICLDPTIQNVVASYRRAFFDTFSRLVKLLKSRSQAFQDYHVTVFDKVLLELTDDGNHLDNPAAIQYFCDEFLAVPKNCTGAEKTSALTDTLTVSKSFLSGELCDASLPNLANPSLEDTALSNTQQSVTSRQAISDTAEQDSLKKSLFGRKLSDPAPADLALLADAVGPRTSRLWSIYVQAKNDFNVITDPSSSDKKTAAIFLRDTAENTLEYLESQAADERLIREVQVTVNVTKRTVMTFFGGRKRKWDEEDVDEHAKSHAKRQPIHSKPKDARERGRRLERTPNFRDSNPSHVFAGHARALARFPGHELSAGEHRGRPSTVVELFPTEPIVKKNQRRNSSKRQPGRGHSGIPFGYTRSVDSYRPDK